MTDKLSTEQIEELSQKFLQTLKDNRYYILLMEKPDDKRGVAISLYTCAWWGAGAVDVLLKSQPHLAEDLKGYNSINTKTGETNE